MPAPEAPSAAADSAALEAQDPEEPAVPVRGRLVLRVRQRVLADLRPADPVPARLALLLQGPVPADLLQEDRAVPAHLVLAVPVELLLSRPSFSVAMGRTTP